MKLYTSLENLDNIPDGQTRKLGSSSGGQGVPTGGTTGQILTKKSNTDYDTEWAEPMSDMYYKPGDVYTITDRAYITVGGSLTASKGQVRFGVFLPKLLTNINSVTVSLAKLTIRNTSGSYIIDYKNVTSALSASKSGDNTVYLSYGAKNMSGTNNTPVSVEINALKLTFN